MNLFLISSLFILVPVNAQDNISKEVITLNKQEIEDLEELAKYDKTEKKLRSKRRNEKDDKKQENNVLGPNFSFGLGPLVRGILYVLIVALVIFILYTIFSSVKVEKKIKPKVSLTEEEIDDIEVVDTKSGLDQALKADNYREGVRMLFIKLLQVLVSEKSIEWKPEKTNRDYLKEMKNHPKIQHFDNLVIAYERIWYGSEPIDKLFFDHLRVDFEKFYSVKNVSIDEKE